MKKKGLNIAILLSGLLLILEVYRWYQWNVDWSKLTVWQFLTNRGNTGLLWNLLLAWIPVILAFLIPKNKRSIFVKFLCFVWLSTSHQLIRYFMSAFFRYIPFKNKSVAELCTYF